MNTIKITKHFDNSVINDILSGCFEYPGGSNYWIDEIRIHKGTTKENKYASTVVSKGGVVVIVEKETGTKHKLTKKKILKGIERYYKKSGAPVDFDYMDDTQYDIILQYSLFKKLIYG